MTDCIHLNSCSVEEFYKVLKSLKGIAPIHARIHILLCEMQKDLSNSAQKVLYIYFSLLEDGNTRIVLDPANALIKWLVKWRSLIKLASTENQELPIPADDAESEFEAVLREGIRDILTQDYSNIIELRAKNLPTEPHGVSRPFVRSVDNRDSMEYLYATRYFDAKCIIEDKAKDVFSFEPSSITDTQRKDCQDYFKPLLNKDENLQTKEILFEYPKEDACFKEMLDSSGLELQDVMAKLRKENFPLGKFYEKNKSLIHYFDRWSVFDVAKSSLPPVKVYLKKASEKHIETILWDVPIEPLN